MGKAEVEAFLTHLAVEQNVVPATQIQALQALLFQYRDVLELPHHWRHQGITRQENLTAADRADCTRGPDSAETSHRHPLPGRLAALRQRSRVNEHLSLRVKDIDFESRDLILWSTNAPCSKTSGTPAPWIL
jgi:hypothetical protein